MPLLDQSLSLMSDLREQIAAVSEAYALMPVIIDEEHEAIKASDLDKVEALTARKLFLGSQLDNLFKNLRASCVAVFELAKSEGLPTSSEVANLSEVFKVFGDLHQHLESRGESSPELAPTLDTLYTALEKFVSIKNLAQQKIEINKAVLNGVLFNRQENYRFWQEVGADSLSAYNSEGKQKAKYGPRSSRLNIKA